MSDEPDEIRFRKDAHRLLGDDVQNQLLSRGWAVADLEVGDEQPLEWFWPPTAPLDYGKVTALPRSDEEGSRELPDRDQTPWTNPTTIRQDESKWRVEFGSAIAQTPDEPLILDDAQLLSELEGIECWPMPVDEAKLLRTQRVYATTFADAFDLFSQAAIRTEPYTSQLEECRDRSWSEPSVAARERATPRPPGDLRARYRLIDAEAWASAVRTARAGGEGWGLNGPET